MNLTVARQLLGSFSPATRMSIPTVFLAPYHQLTFVLSVGGVVFIGLEEKIYYTITNEWCRVQAGTNVSHHSPTWLGYTCIHYIDSVIQDEHHSSVLPR